MDKIDQLIEAHRRQDVPEKRRLETELISEGYEIDYGPAGVYWNRPAQPAVPYRLTGRWFQPKH